VTTVLTCPACGARLEVADHSFDRTVLCRACNQRVQLPSVPDRRVQIPREGGAANQAAPASDDLAGAEPAQMGRKPTPLDRTEAAPPRKGVSWVTIILIGVGVFLLLCVAGVLLAVPITSWIIESSKMDIAKANIKGILVPAVKRYQLDLQANPDGNLPDSLEQLLNENSRIAGLTREVLIDPWGRPYQYSSQSTHGQDFDIWSDGSGGSPIGNWTP
jgi:hypothetical protein